MEMTDEKFNSLTSEIIKNTGLFKCPICGHTDGFDFKPYQYVIVQGETLNDSVQLGGSIINSTDQRRSHANHLTSRLYRREYST